jgi:hypothetical protein
MSLAFRRILPPVARLGSSHPGAEIWSRRLDRPGRFELMMCALNVRKLKPGTYEEFRRAWEPVDAADWPRGLKRTWIARHDDDPDIVATWSLFDLDPAGVEALRDDMAWVRADAARLERIAEFEAEFISSGFFEVVDEVTPPAG